MRIWTRDSIVRFRIRPIFIKLIDRKLCIAKVCIGFRIADYKGFPDKKANIRLLERIPLKMDWEIGRNFTLNLGQYPDSFR